jgi:DNA-3-methyladenine glycosylase
MLGRRGVATVAALCSGPGKLCQALAIDSRLNGASLVAPPFEIRPAERPADVARGRRIGITVGVDTPWRFAEAGSRFLSRAMETGGA